jgi:menaquinone-dependent protoporphyrinogen oxidase
MSNILVVYASRYGQTAKIAHYVAQVLREHAHTVGVAAVGTPAADRIAEFDAVIVGSSINIGRLSRHLASLLAGHAEALDHKPTALFTVCLAEAGTDEKPKQDVRRIVADFLRMTGLRPHEQSIFAGALKYRSYGRLLRLVMKWIAGRAGGATDTSQDWEYTDWNAVAAFAERFADRVASPGPHVPSSKAPL